MFIACHYTCGKCTNNSNYDCTICASNRIFITDIIGKLCMCKYGYYHIENIVECPLCDIICESCITSSENCLVCNGDR